MRLIDADALLDDVMKRYCKDCDKRKGIKNGKWRIIYEIGEAPCRACEVDDAKAELEEAPTIDAAQVVRCKDCKYIKEDFAETFHCENLDTSVWEDHFCCWAERREDETD